MKRTLLAAFGFLFGVHAGMAEDFNFGTTGVKSVTGLLITEDASADTQFNLVDIRRDDVSVCLVKLKGECIFEYDAPTKSFTVRRPIIVEVGQ